VVSRIAIANRGEAAMRLIHAVRDINAAGDGVIETVALHTTNEVRAMFVREADLSHDLGPAAARPYVDLAALERALTETGADAGIDRLAKKYLGKDKYPWKGPNEVRVIVKIAPEKVHIMG